MPDTQPTPDPQERERIIQLDLLYYLTDPDDNQPLWTSGDLARALNVNDVEAYTNPLEEAGLIHKTSDGHVFASRATVYYVKLVGHGVS